MAAVSPEDSRHERVPAGTALAVCLVTLAALGMLFLVDYVRRGFHYPVGWDAPYYVWRANEVGFDGLARIGGVRSASPLLMTILMEATRQSAFTVVSLVPPILAGIAGLGSAVMVRAALAVDTIW